MVNNFHYILQ